MAEPAFWQYGAAADAAKASPTYESEVLKRAGSLPRLGAVPSAAPAAPVPTPTAPIEVPPWLKKSARFGAAAGLGVAAVGAGTEAANTTNGATYENRPERALQILGGMDSTGFGARIGRFLTGQPEPVDANPVLGPSGQAYAGGARASVTTPAPEGAQMVKAFGPDFKPTYPLPNVNEGVGAVQAQQPGVVTGSPGSFNVVDKGAFSGLDPATSAALSQARQSAAARGDFGAVADSYRANGGTWMGKTAAQAQKEEALADTMRGIRKSRTVAQQKNFMDMYGHQVTAEATAAHNAATLGVQQAENRRKATHDATTAYTDLLKAQSSGNEQDAKAAQARLSVAMALQHHAGGGSASEVAAIAQGHALPNDKFSVPLGAMPDAKTGAFPVISGQTGKITSVAPSRSASEANITATMKERGLSRAATLARYQAEGFDVSKLK